MRVFDIGGGDGPDRVSDRVLTVPNLLSFARLAILPVVYLDLVSQEPGRLLRAFVLLAVFSTTDWFDGYIARRFDQVSRLGKLLDPLSDRVLLVVVGVGFGVGQLLPWWAILLVLGRDVLTLATGAVVLLRGGIRPEVTRLGKAGTFGLMFAFPAFLLAAIVGEVGDPEPVLWFVGWAVYWVSLVMYWISGLGYSRRVLLPRHVLEAEREASERAEAAAGGDGEQP